jgi:lysophospholipase L1-like esterase
MPRLINVCCTRLLLVGILILGLVQAARGETVFVEAESMVASSEGWKATQNDQTRRASRLKTLWGADGAVDAVATRTVKLNEAGTYRVWVRYMQVAAWRGPFQVAVATAGKTVATQVFDREVIANVEDWEYTWQSFDAELPAGDVTLTLAKHEQKNCVGYVRHVDCILLTNDMKRLPDHLPYGPQTLVRVTLGEDFERPVYLHLFADHYRSPWYAHFAIGKDGLHAALAPPEGQLLKTGEPTPWCNLTPTVYQDSGAALNFSLRHTYHEKAKRFRAKLEFGYAPTSTSAQVDVVKTFDVEAVPNGLVIIVPPDLESKANIARLQRDRDFAEEIGHIADAFKWPTYGKRPTKIPFLVTASIGGYDLQVDAAVTAREQKTLDNFGFNGGPERILHGLWHMQGDSYCRPDINVMRERIKHDVDLFHKSGRKLDDIAAVMLMDEPTGQSAAFAAKDEAYRDKFREWLKAKSLRPEDLLVTSWDQVRPVVETERDQFPALHYFTQLFRTRAIGDFMATQRRIIEEAYGRAFPTLVNFSDGAVYQANFCSQGIDYFELLDADDQNAIWGEDWANNSSTYQCGAYNVALMQAAARRRGQTIGHYLIAHAGRTPWDIKTKATSETARGVRVWQNFSYGPNWASHEGGSAWKSHLWHRRPELWTANAEISREIGAVEDWLLTAKPAKAEVAVLYSSSSDIWTMQSNLAYGFDRMHTWLALTHAQTPVDIVPEREIERLDHYKVCYLSGPNLTRAAAAKLRQWVEAGGTLWLTAGAAQRDEFNRPLNLLGDLSSVEQGEVASFEPFQNAGKFLSHLAARDTVTWGDQQLEVLSVKQPLKVVSHAVDVTEKDSTTNREKAGGEQTQNKPRVLATFKDGQPAAFSSRAGKGSVYTLGFLPALSYIKPALIARRPLEQQADVDRVAAEKLAAAAADQPLATSASVSTPNSQPIHTGSDRELLERSHNPWLYPAGIREKMLAPVQAASVSSKLQCSTPLVDAVALQCEQGTLIALSNHTLQPLAQIELRLKTSKPVTRIESVRHGVLPIKVEEGGVTSLHLPLEASDYVMVTHEPDELHIGKLHVSKVLFLGNSLTLHGPAPQIGWTGNWGMAATAREKDFVHRLLDRITQTAGGEPRVMIRNIADFERGLDTFKVRETLKQELAFKPDLIIIAIGENAATPKTDAARTQFATAFANLLAESKQDNQPTIIVRSQFWQDAEKDQLLQKASTDAKAIFLDVSKLGQDPANFARAERQIEHAGVAAHPGDKGMQALADALWTALRSASGTND